MNGHVKSISICVLMLLLVSNWIYVPVYGANYDVTIIISIDDETGGCRIKIDGVIRQNGDVLSLSEGTHTCEAITPSGWSFFQWYSPPNTPVTDPYNPSTTFTVNGNGGIWADWGPIVTFYCSPSGGGSISVYYYGAPTPFTETYSNGQSGVIKGYSSELRANPAPGYTFSSWSTTGSVSVSSPTSTPTLWSPTGPGTVTASFQAQQAYSINLKSDGTDGIYNTGTITFAGTSYTLPTTISKAAASYSITGNPPSGYRFQGWRSGQGVSVTDPNAQSTTATVSGNGWLEAVWYPVGRYPVLLATSTADGQTNVGSISVSGTDYNPGTVVWMGSSGSSVTGNPPPNYVFDRWETSGYVTVADPNAQSTTAFATGSGTLKAWFKPSAPTTYAINFYTNPSNVGSITFSGTTYTNGQSGSYPAGSYGVTANIPSGYAFSSWSTSGGTSVTSSTSSSTTATVSGSGSITANFQAVPAQPLPAPTGLTATAVSSSQINLAWTDNSADESDFHIERRASGTSWVEIATVLANTQSYSDTGLSGSTTYYYKVRAHRHSDSTYSPYSNEASATPSSVPPPPLPATPNLISPSDGVTLTSTPVTFTWSGSSGATDYQIEINGPTSKLETVYSTSYTTTLSQGSYTWRVRAHNSDGWSDWTLPWSLTIKISYSVVIVVRGPSSINIDMYVDGSFTQSIVGGGGLANLEFEKGTSHKIRLITPSIEGSMSLLLQVQGDQLSLITGEITVDQAIKIFVLYISEQDLMSLAQKIKETIIKEFTDPQTYIKFANSLREGINEYSIIIDLPASLLPGGVGSVIKLYFDIEQVSSIVAEQDVQKINRFAGTSIYGGIWTISCLILAASAGVTSIPVGGVAAIPVLGACGAGGAIFSFLTDKLASPFTEALGSLTNKLTSSIYMWLIYAAQKVGKFLGISGGSNVTITVVDPKGHYAGLIPAGGDEISDAIYSGFSSHPQVVIIPSPLEGEYKIIIRGRESGEFHLGILTYSNGTETYNKTISQMIGAGEEKQLGITIGSQAEGAISTNTMSIVNSISLPDNVIVGDLFMVRSNISDPEGIRQVNIDLLDPSNRWHNYTALYLNGLYVQNIDTSDFSIGGYKAYLSILDGEGFASTEVYSLQVLGKIFLIGSVPKTEVISGEIVTVTLTLKDQDEQPIGFASVNVTFAGKTYGMQYSGEGRYVTTLDTQGLEGNYIVEADASKQMYLAAEYSLPLTVRPWWWPYLPYLIGVPLLVVLLITSGILLKRSRRPMIKPPEEGLIVASPEVIQALEGAKDSLEKGMYAPAVISASERLRSDLINRLKLKPSSTNEEIIETLNRTNIGVDHREVRPLLKLADKCKFGEYVPTKKEAGESLEKASNILRKLGEINKGSN